MKDCFVFCGLWLLDGLFCLEKCCHCFFLSALKFNRGNNSPIRDLQGTGWHLISTPKINIY